LNRDNFLFALIGILVGFIAGYLMQEVMVTRQPARLVHGQTGPVTPGAGAPASDPRTNPQAAAQARAEEMQQLETFLESNPDDPRAVLRMAALNYDARRWPECVEYYERYLELEPARPDVLSDLGVCYRESGDPQQALESFDHAQEIQPDHWQSRFNEVVILAFDLNEYALAEQVLDELRELQPEDAAAQRNIERLAEEVARRQASAESS
jgi:tetratricopeptide (TPR) repeat protein